MQEQTNGKDNEKLVKENETKEVVEETKEVVENDLPEDEDGKETDFGKEEEGVANQDETEPKDKQKQSKKDNAYYANQRREREKKEREELEKKANLLAKDNYQKGLFKANKGINPFTNEALQTDYDYEVLENMLEMDEKGLDPMDVTSYTKFIKEKNAQKIAEQEKATKQAEAETQRVTNELKDFSEKYPDVDLKKLMDDKKFQRFLDFKSNEKTFTDAYEMFIENETESDKKAQEKYEDKQARMFASDGSLKGSGNIDDYIPLEDIKKMSPKEIDANWEKVKKSYDHWMNQK